MWAAGGWRSGGTTLGQLQIEEGKNGVYVVTTLGTLLYIQHVPHVPQRQSFQHKACCLLWQTNLLHTV